MSNSQLNTQITDAIRAHGAWKLKLKAAIKTGNSDLKPEDVRHNDRCAFGQWLKSPDIDAPTRGSVPYKVISRLHSEFHECAGDVIECVVSGKVSDASQLLETTYEEKSDKLTRGLRKWRREEG